MRTLYAFGFVAQAVEVAAGRAAGALRATRTMSSEGMDMAAALSTHSAAAGGAGMQPVSVAKILANLEGQWRSDAIDFNACVNSSKRSKGMDESLCEGPANQFHKSCVTVAAAVLKASRGSFALASAYVSEICNASPLEGWKRDRCRFLGDELHGGLHGGLRRNTTDSDRLCSGVWARFREAEVKDIAKKHAEKSAETSRASEALERIDLEDAAQGIRVAEEKKVASLEKHLDSEEQAADAAGDEARQLLSRAHALAAARDSNSPNSSKPSNATESH